MDTELPLTWRISDAGLDGNWNEQLYGKLLAVTGGNERIRYFLSDLKTDVNDEGDLAQFIALLHAAKTKHYVKLLESNGIATSNLVPSQKIAANIQTVDDLKQFHAQQ